MKHFLIAAAAVLIAASAAEPASAAFHFNGRVDPDAQLYRRTYDNETSGISFSRSSRASVSRTRTVRTSSRSCPRSRSLLGIFGDPALTTGTSGFTVPGLINGECPLSAGILKVRESGNSPFGSMDF